MNSSANGVSPDYAVGIAEPLGDVAAATDAELSDGTPSAEEVIDEDAPVSVVAETPRADARNRRRLPGRR